MDDSDFYPSQSSGTLTYKSDNHKNIAHKKRNCYRMFYFTKKIQQYFPSLLKIIPKEERWCQRNWQIYIFRQKWSNSPMIDVQLPYQDVKI